MNRTSVFAVGALASLLVAGDAGDLSARWIVTFDASSSVRRNLENAPPDAYEARLAAALTRLSSEVGVPIADATALGGGSWQLRADTAAVLDRIEALASAAPGVSRVRRVPVGKSGVLGVAEDRELEVVLAADARAEAVESELELAAIPTLRVRRGDAILLRIDWPELTRATAERLRTRPGVRAVEFDRVATPQPGASGPTASGPSCA